MKTNNRIFITLLLISISINSYCQILTIQETVNYINEKLINNQYTTSSTPLLSSLSFIPTPKHDPYNYWDQIAVSEDGRITWSYYKLKETKIIKESETYFYLTDFNEEDLYNISLNSHIPDGGHTNMIYCKNNENCVTDLGNRNENNEFTFSNTSSYFALDTPKGDLYERKKVLNAFKYLFSLVLENEQMKRKDTDPFAPENYKKTISGSTGSNKNNKTVVQLKDANGVYTITVHFGEIVKRFILDSGASHIAISTDLENILLKNNLITESSYLPNAFYRTADGSVSECKRVLLKKITVGGLTVRNVIASIGNYDSPLLLGKSFLDKFKKWSIDNGTGKLSLEL